MSVEYEQVFFLVLFNASMESLPVVFQPDQSVIHYQMVRFLVSHSPFLAVPAFPSVGAPAREVPVGVLWTTVAVSR